MVSHVSYIIYNSVFHLYKSANKLISNSCRFHNILEIMFLKVVGVCFSFSLNNSALTANYPCPDFPTELLGHFSQPPRHHFIFSVFSFHTHSKKKGPLFDPLFFPKVQLWILDDKKARKMSVGLCPGPKLELKLFFFLFNSDLGCTVGNCLNL